MCVITTKWMRVCIVIDTAPDSRDPFLSEAGFYLISRMG